MSGWLRGLRRGWLLLMRGECEAEGCTEPARGFPLYGEFCGEHFDQHMRELHQRHEAREFEHEVRVQTEALRRIEAEKYFERFKEAVLSEAAVELLAERLYRFAALQQGWKKRWDEASEPTKDSWREDARDHIEAALSKAQQLMEEGG